LCQHWKSIGEGSKCDSNCDRDCDSDSDISIFGRFYCVALMILLTLLSRFSIFVDATVLHLYFWSILLCCIPDFVHSAVLLLYLWRCDCVASLCLVDSTVLHP
jgi:hypothetical protein